jgi:hypothetical protein
MSDSNVSFIRWQATTIAQLTYTTNLVLTFSVALLGFQVSLIVGNSFRPLSWEKYTFGASVLVAFFAIVLGMWLAVNRLCSFRQTSAAARERERGKTDVARKHRENYGTLDARTWPLFWGQLATFTVGVALLALSIAGVAIRKFL